MNPRTHVRVPAKINLSLGVGVRREDGFHSLATVYQAIDLCDEVRVGVRDDDQLTVVVYRNGEVVDDGSVPDGPDNIAIQAAMTLRKHAERTDLGADIAIRKEIPVAGGMAGGSANAAATLVACNEAWGLGYTREELEPLAAELGSDVPFLLHGGNALGYGHGEQVNAILSRGTFHWVAVTSDVGLSTAAVYAEFDRLNPVGVVDPQVAPELFAALRSGDVDDLGAALSNDLTEAALSLRPDLAAVMDLGMSLGAVATLLSGSGPTVLFLARDPGHSEELAAMLAAAAAGSDVVQAYGPVPGVRFL